MLTRSTYSLALFSITIYFTYLVIVVLVVFDSFTKFKSFMRFFGRWELYEIEKKNRTRPTYKIYAKPVNSKTVRVRWATDLFQDVANNLLLYDPPWNSIANANEELSRGLLLERSLRIKAGELHKARAIAERIEEKVSLESQRP